MLKDLEIGHRYNNRGIIYEVREEDENNVACRDCAFYVPYEGVCTDAFPDRMGYCGRFHRRDNKQVIFVEVGEGEPDPQDRVVEVIDNGQIHH